MVNLIQSMLAGKAPDDLTKLRYPVLVSPKIDGIRASVQNGIVYSRSLIPIPNKQVQAWYGRNIFNGLDGELMVGDPTDPDSFNRTTSLVMSHDGKSGKLRFYIFDDLDRKHDTFNLRLDRAQTRVQAFNRTMRKSVNFINVNHVRVESANDVGLMEEKWLADGYEGLMIRAYHGAYKEGRSTTKEGGLLKLKRFVDSEAEIVGFNEMVKNLNEATIDETGHTKRSSKKDGMKAMNTLGSFIVKDLKTKTTFECGSGLNPETRKQYWKNRDKLLGQTIKYKYQQVGTIAKPRLPIFLGFRAPFDI